jgi:hypothetical protein
MANTSGNSRVRSVIGTILIGLPGLALGVSAILKFAGVPGVVHQMAQSGFADGKLMLVAGLEILSSLFFLYPRTRSFGLLFLSSFLGGAICVHVQMGEFPKAIGPAMLLTFAWAGTWLRHPEMLWSFAKQISTRNLDPERREARLASREA